MLQEKLEPPPDLVCPPGSPSVPTVSSPVPSSSGEQSPPVAPPKQKKKRKETSIFYMWQNLHQEI